ncbi:transglycosylase SLT domain-containing protein, partial [Escherichia coli]|uniref:transglycosylase SLT domain-containing protein n=1 Tax=Escherichia coli TaxID=562 RepID=UPI0021C62C34
FLQTTSPRRIDVGIAQVNWGWNGHQFRSAWEAFDPYTNLHVAARILRRCYEASPGSWIRAAGCYHHPAGGQPAVRYKNSVRRQLATLTGG